MSDTNPNDKGLPEGITAAMTGHPSHSAGAPNAPAMSADAPAKEPVEEKDPKAPAEDKTPAEPKEDKPADKQDTPAEDEQKPAEEVATEYPDYGDENANAVVSLLKESNVTAHEAHELFQEAIATGDFTKIDIAKLTEKLGAAKATLVLNGIKTYYNTVTASTKETVSAVYDAVGGEANYKKVQEWARAVSAKDPAFAAEVAGLNAMFDLNKTAAVMAAKHLISMYEKDSNNSSLTRTQVHGDSAVTTADSAAPYISRQDYLTQMKEAQAKNDHVTISRLRAQRAASLNA